jgi:hypothetical protein
MPCRIGDEMKRLPLPVVVAAFGLALVGCAGSSGKGSPTTSVSLATTRSAHDSVRVIAGSRNGIGGVNLHNSARFLSPRRLAILTWGSFTCPAVPNRLVVETPDTIRIHLTSGSWHGKQPVAHLPPGEACTADHSSAVIVIAIDPKRINVHHPLTIRLFYYRIGKPQIRIAPPL